MSPLYTTKIKKPSNKLQTYQSDICLLQCLWGHCHASPNGPYPTTELTVFPATRVEVQAVLWDMAWGVCQGSCWEHVHWPSNRCACHRFQQGHWEGRPWVSPHQAPELWCHRTAEQLDPELASRSYLGGCCLWGAVRPSPSNSNSPTGLSSRTLSIPLRRQHHGGKAADIRLVLSIMSYTLVCMEQPQVGNRKNHQG